MEVASASTGSPANDSWRPSSTEWQLGAANSDDRSRRACRQQLNRNQSLILKESFAHRVARHRPARREVVLDQDAAWGEQRNGKLEGLFPRPTVEEDEVEGSPGREDVLPAGIQDFDSRSGQRGTGLGIARRVGLDGYKRR